MLIRRSYLVTSATVAAVTVASACLETERPFDSHPLPVTIRSDAVFVGLSGSDGVIREATIDTLSPITVLDSAVGSAAAPARFADALTLYSAAGVPRLTFPNTEVFDLHPCDNGGAFSPCSVGLDDETSEIRGIVGTNMLRGQSVRFDFANAEVRMFPDIAGTTSDRGELCEAVFGDPFAGGGTLVVADGEVDYSANRPALGACLDSENPIDGSGPARERGADVLFVVSTGLGPSVMSQSAYDRYAAAADAPLAADLEAAVLHLPSGPVGAKRGTLGHISLLGEVGSDSQRRGPCRELFANRILAIDGCNTGVVAAADCPCPDNKTFCRAAGALLLAGPIDVAVLPDENPLLQALRVELRPEFPEVDGILGAGALAPTRLDFDYPNARILGRCSDETRCASRPQVSRFAELDAVRACLDRDPPQ